MFKLLKTVFDSCLKPLCYLKSSLEDFRKTLFQFLNSWQKHLSNLKKSNTQSPNKLLHCFIGKVTQLLQFITFFQAAQSCSRCWLKNFKTDDSGRTQLRFLSWDGNEDPMKPAGATIKRCWVVLFGGIFSTTAVWVSWLCEGSPAPKRPPLSQERMCDLWPTRRTVRTPNGKQQIGKGRGF